MLSNNIFKLGLVVGAAITYSASLAQARDYMEIRDWDFAGTILDVHKGDVSACKTKCNETPKCIAFSYKPEDPGNCILRSTSFHRTSSPNAITYILNMTSVYPERNYQSYIEYEGYHVTSTAIHTASNVSEDECKYLCNQFPSCSAANYLDSVKNPRSCELSSESLHLQFREHKAFKTFLVDNTRVPRRNYKLEGAVSYYGSTITSWKGPSYQCPYICDRTPGCVGFEIDLTGERDFCHLKSSVTNKIVTSNVWGYYLSDHKGSTQRVGTKRDYIVAPGKKILSSAQSNHTVTTPEDCMSICDKTEGCYGASVVNGNRCEIRHHLERLTEKDVSSSNIVTYYTLDKMNGKIYSGNLTDYKRLYRDDKIVSVNQKSVFHLHFDGTADISYYSVPVAIFRQRANMFSASPTGQLRKFNADGSFEVIGTGVAGINESWNVQMTDDLILRVIRVSDGKIGYQSLISASDVPYWAYSVIVGKDINDTNNNRQSNWGAGTKIYYIDSGVTTDFDSASTFSDNQKDNYIEGPYLSSISSTAGDLYLHGTSLVVMSKSKMAGLAEGSEVVSVKITDLETRYFTEKSFVSALAWVDLDLVNANTTKIINFSGAFFGGNTDFTKCAIQWAFYRNILVIVAAGNSNSSTPASSPYDYTVGSFTKSKSSNTYNIWSDSNFGTDIDMWAPNEFISQDRVGTSFATGYVSAAAAIAISKYPQLRNKPLAVFSYLSERANTNLIGNDFKTTGAFHKRALSIQSFDSNPPNSNFVDNSANFVDFCRAFNLDRKIPNWDELISRASSTKIGQIVNQTSASTRGGSSNSR
jgi:hypothetical protein